ncbi:ankyrin repeat domain-containing protein [Thermodesulfobacteriota bacterium]
MTRLIIMLVFLSLVLGAADVPAGWLVVFYSKECKSAGHGQSEDLESAMDEAERSCLKNGCKDCRYLGRSKKRCYALARSSSGRVRGAGRDDLERAERRAVEECESKWGRGCRVFARHCQDSKPRSDRHEKSREEENRQRDKAEKIRQERKKQRDRAEKSRDERKKQHDKAVKSREERKKQHDKAVKSREERKKQHDKAVKSREERKRQHEKAKQSRDERKKQRDKAEKARDKRKKQRDRVEKLGQGSRGSVRGVAEAKDKSVNLELITASSQGNLDAVKQLIADGADVNTKNNDFRTALMEASKGGRLAIVKYLVEKGANVDDITKDSRTALMDASRNGHLDTVVYLVEKGADVNVKTISNGITAIMIASGAGELGLLHPNIVKFLVLQGADVNAQDSEGRTALMWVERHSQTKIGRIQGSFGVVEFLKSHGAQ